MMQRTVRAHRTAAYCLSAVIPSILLSGCSSGVTESPEKSADASTRVQPEVVSKVNENLGLSSHDIVTAEVVEDQDAVVRATLPIAGKQETLELTPFSVRSKNYQLIVQAADGSLVHVEPGPLRTFRGNVTGLEGSVVAGSLDDSGLQARVFMPDGEQFWIQPLETVVEDDVPQGLYVVHREVDMLGTDHTDVVLTPENDDGDADDGGHATAFGSGCGGTMCTADLAVDSDYEFYQHWGSVAAVEQRVNTVINTMNIQFERDVAITHAISTIVVRTTANDPYATTNAEVMLSEFRSEWLDNFPEVPRDVAQLFTGKNIHSNGSSSVIGIAWLNGVCTSIGFSIVEQFGTSLGLATDLSAHEFGHNWGANHCSCSNPDFTMNSFLTGANIFHASHSIPEIIQFRDSRNCLESAFECQNDADCSDGDFCNGVESCNGGVCVAGSPVDCADGNACTVDTCSPSGGCSNTPLDCDDGNECTVDSCDGVLGCVNVPINCDDGNACTEDACNPQTGVCSHGSGDCNDGNACTVDTCDPDEGCTHAPVSCDDGDACTWDNCGPISGCWHTPVSCEGDEACTDYGCDSLTGCWSEPLDSCCGDGDCNNGEDCSTCPDDCGTPNVGGCGNGVCEPSLGEDCLNCEDCAGRQTGNPLFQFCCGDGDGVNPVSCGDERCNKGHWECDDTPVDGACCGDGVCDASESSCTCAADCGAFAPVESDCSNNADDDCDGVADCDDPDCAAEDVCAEACVRTHRQESGPRCSDGLDNDCDGMIDKADPDCQ